IEPLETAATALAGEVLTVLLDAPLWLRLAVLDEGDVHHAAAQLQRRLDRISDARPWRPRRVHRLRPHHDAANHHLDTVLPPAVNARRFLHPVGLPIHPPPAPTPP